MRVNVRRDDFARLLATNAKVVESRNTIPILSHLHLSANGETLTVRGTDLDTEATGSIAAEGEAGAVCVDAKLLTDIIRKSTGEEVSLEFVDPHLVVKAGRSRFKLQTLPPEDFPTMAGGAYDTEFEIDLAAFLAPVAFAMSDEETRFYLCGALVHADAGELVTVATDGHRLARNGMAHDVAASLEGMPGVIIPRKTVGLLPKGAVTLAVSDNKIRITAADGSTLVSKLIDGTFPDYNRVIPRGNENKVTFDRDALMKAADRVTTVSDGRGRGLKLTIGRDEIELSMRQQDEAEDVVACVADEPAEIGFNGAYLAATLAAMPPGEITMKIDGSGAPGLFTSASAPGWLGVIMPMRV